MKKYIVCWVETYTTPRGSVKHISHYNTYDKDSDDNYSDAYIWFNYIKGLNNTYSANLCEIIKSTDY